MNKAKRKATYYVEIPVRGFMRIFVEANSEKEAIEKAREAMTEENLEEWELEESDENVDIYESME